MCSYFGGFSKDKHFVNVSIKLCLALTVYTSCLIPVAYLNVSEYLPLSEPLWGVVFQEEHWAREETSFWTAGTRLYNIGLRFLLPSTVVRSHSSVG